MELEVKERSEMKPSCCRQEVGKGVATAKTSVQSVKDVDPVRSWLINDRIGREIPHAVGRISMALPRGSGIGDGYASSHSPHGQKTSVVW